MYFCSKFANVRKKTTYLLRISNLMCNTRLTQIVQQNILHSPIGSQLLTPCPLIYHNSRQELFARRMISFLLPFSRPLPNNISETSPEKFNAMMMMMVTMAMLLTWACHCLSESGQCVCVCEAETKVII